MKKSVAVLGLGKFGSSVARARVEQKCWQSIRMKILSERLQMK